MTTTTIDRQTFPAVPATAIPQPGLKSVDLPPTTTIDGKHVRPWGSGLFSVADIHAWLASRAADFKAGLVNILRIKGIDTRPEMIFQFNGMGNITLITEHADHDVIERLFNRDKELRKAFVDIAATARFLDVVTARPDFEECYTLNPEKAMADYAHLAASLTRPTFNLQVSRAGLTTHFTPLP